MKRSLKISIITPNFNYAQFIDKTIYSVLLQGYDNFEHIIVDDGSTDNSIGVIEGIIKLNLGVIKLIKQTNKGQTQAINRALKEVTGDIIGWINSDDLYCEGAFLSVINEFQKKPNLDAVFGDIYIIDKNESIIKTNRYLAFDYTSGVFNGFGKIVSSNAIFWRKELTDQVGLFDESFSIAMDSEYWSRLLFKRRIIHIPVILAKFRWHEDAKTIVRNDKQNSNFIKGKNEDSRVYYNSYKKLKLSKYIPLRYSAPIRFSYRLKRYLLRFIKGHYRNE